MTTINPVEIIRKKRDGEKLSASEIDAFIQNSVNGPIPDYQVSAFLMAVFFQGMDLDETMALTRSMIQSGAQIRFDDKKPRVDKHSTGGIGDKTSLIVAPIVAALGVEVPMVAGRGLGFTGGTLDKLESIKGFRVNLSVEEFKSNVLKHGVAMAGQTGNFVPADKKLYALRDVTATVESIPLITASILSKKVAEGITGLVLDIKVGCGAFMKTQKEAERLAKFLVAVGTKMGLKVRVLLTDMNQPLGLEIGNAHEILESIEVLNDGGPCDLRDLSIELAAHMLVLAEKSSSLSAARAMARKTLQDGSALKKFHEMCLAQGAKPNGSSIIKPVVSTHRFDVPAKKAGYIGKINAEAIGLFLIDLGAGRKKVNETIDHTVGITMHAKLGTAVKKEDPMATVYYNPEKLSAAGLSLTAAKERVTEMFTIASRRPELPALIKKVIT